MDLANYKYIMGAFNKFSPFGKMNCGIYDVGVRFLTTNVDGVPVDMCLSVGALSEDWYGDCISCPENDAIIQKLEIFFDGYVETIPAKRLIDFFFSLSISITTLFLCNHIFIFSKQFYKSYIN